MFCYFETLVDSYVDYSETHMPPTRLRPDLRAAPRCVAKAFWARQSSECIGTEVEAAR